MNGSVPGPPAHSMPPAITGEPLHPLLRVRLGPLLVLAALAFGLPIAGALLRLSGPFAGKNFLVTASLITYGLFVVWLAVALPRAGISWSRLFGRPPGPGRVIEILLVAWMHILFAANSFVLMLAGLYQVAPRLARELAEIANMSRTMGSTPSPGLALMMVVVAPVVEEVLFRGVLLQHFALRWGAPRAVLVTSAIFAALHPQHPIGLFVFSVLLSLLFLASRSLLASIAAHALTNGTLLAIALVAARGPAATPDMDRLVTAAPAAAAGFLLVSVFVALYAWRRWPRGAEIPYDEATA